MSNPAKLVRVAAIFLAWLFVVVGLSALVGVWWIDRQATQMTRTAFEMLRTGVGTVEDGARRVDAAVGKARAEIAEATRIVRTAVARIDGNAPLLDALSARLESGLAPPLAQLQQALPRLREATGTIASMVSLLNALPTVAENAPRLGGMEDATQRLDEVLADLSQARGSLQVQIAEQRREITAEAGAALQGILQRIDARLGQLQGRVQETRTVVADLGGRLEQRERRIRWAGHLLAVLMTFGLAWMIYSQAIVIRYHRTTA